MRRPFCILSVLGDMLDDGELRFVEAARTLDAAKARVRSLSKVSPGEYVIYDVATGSEYPLPPATKRQDPATTPRQSSG
jgi:hypothetical protein